MNSDKPYKHTFSFGSNYSKAVLLGTFTDKRKRRPYDIDILEKFPNSLTDMEKLQILEGIVDECRREIRKLKSNIE